MVHVILEVAEIGRQAKGIQEFGILVSEEISQRLVKEVVSLLQSQHPLWSMSKPMLPARKAILHQ